jgi:aminoglycoside phosphotransferase (APT) family kinase protein
MSKDALFAGTAEVREAHRFDEAALANWMSRHVADFVGPLSVAQFRGGQSNPTYKLTTPSKSYVLRRKPPGQLLKGAHAVEREAKVMSALGGTGFPVPRVHGLCTDDAVIGTWFFVMDMIEGRIFWDLSLPDIDRAERPRYFDSMNATIASLHRADYRAIGLEDFGRPGNYFQRQIERWGKQYHADEAAGRDPHMDKLLEWLPEHIPPGDETSLIHGDFRIDNMIFHPTEPRVLAVLDWELATLGHPLGDFAYHLMMYRLPTMALSGLRNRDLRELNIPSEGEYVASYCRRTGRAGIASLDFYLAFNFFRFAAIIHGIKGRMLRGSAASEHASVLVASLPMTAELGWAQTQGKSN